MILRFSILFLNRVLVRSSAEKLLASHWYKQRMLDIANNRFINETNTFFPLLSHDDYKLTSFIHFIRLRNTCKFNRFRGIRISNSCYVFHEWRLFFLKNRHGTWRTSHWKYWITSTSFFVQLSSSIVGGMENWMNHEFVHRLVDENLW